MISFKGPTHASIDHTSVCPLVLCIFTQLSLTAKRDIKAALRFFNRAIGSNGKTGLIITDKSGANKAGINQFNLP